MSGPIGHTYIYNIVIIFIIIVFAFLCGIVSYYKAFKVNNRIVGAIEEFEGYNAASKEEIDKNLSNFGYSLLDANCPDRYKNMILVKSLDENYEYCVYISEENPPKDNYFNYGVLTYMKIELPIVNLIKIPVFTKTNQIYKFTSVKPNVD